MELSQVINVYPATALGVEICEDISISHLILLNGIDRAWLSISILAFQYRAKWGSTPDRTGQEPPDYFTDSSLREKKIMHAFYSLVLLWNWFHSVFHVYYWQWHTFHTMIEA